MKNFDTLQGDIIFVQLQLVENSFIARSKGLQKKLEKRKWVVKLRIEVQEAKETKETNGYTKGKTEVPTRLKTHLEEWTHTDSENLIEEI